ncbi:tRNA uridine-5-carboxymethylaminomethyl(34) synthesis GTPase MnmE [Elusimicrobiota bacterium]
MDTIVACATPPGHSALGIIRLSGDNAFEIVSRFFISKPNITEAGSWRAMTGKILRKDPDLGPQQPTPSPDVIDTAVAIKYSSPKSYTGEDMVELMCHGSPLILREIVLAAVRRGARQAMPGEFTQRAFLNGKLDLMQAEAVAGLIKSSSRKSINIHNQALSGKASTQIRNIKNSILDQLAILEVLIDHPDDRQITDNTSTDALNRNINTICQDLGALGKTYKHMAKLRSGTSLVIAGSPNAGKSTLLNSILNKERAIVSAIPGTTRDTIEEAIEVNGHLIKLIDTAGFTDTEDPVEKMGISRIEEAIKRSDACIWIFDGTADFNRNDSCIAETIARNNKPVILVFNKMDLPNFSFTKLPQNGLLEIASLKISALKNTGIDSLISAIKGFIEKDMPTESLPIITEERHADLISQCKKALRDCLEEAVDDSLDTAGAHLRYALRHIEEILGEGDISKEVLDRVFSKFCIGK